MYGYVRRVCYIPAQILYAQTNKLRVRICTEMYGEFAISRHKYYTPRQTNYGYGYVRICTGMYGYVWGRDQKKG